MLKTVAIALAAFFVLTAESCDNPPTSDQVQRHQQEALSKQSNAVVGMPAITHFTMKKQLKMIQELMDRPDYVTYTYFVGMHNEHTPLCRSIGFGISETTEYTNPMRPLEGNTQAEFTTIPQADPDGLFHTSTGNGTLVVCMTKDGKTALVRSEPNVVTMDTPWSNLDQSGM